MTNELPWREQVWRAQVALTRETEGLPPDLIEEGWRNEERPVHDGKAIRGVVTRGKHTDSCERTGDGWICVDNCPVEDMGSVSKFCVIVDTLIEVVPRVERRWLKVHWTLSRNSHQQHFVNGRSRRRDVVITEAVWHRGAAWTKRGARKAMQKFSEA